MKPLELGGTAYRARIHAAFPGLLDEPDMDKCVAVGRFLYEITDYEPGDYIGQGIRSSWGYGRVWTWPGLSRVPDANAQRLIAENMRKIDDAFLRKLKEMEGEV